MGIKDWLSGGGVITGVVGAARDAFVARSERKAAEKTLEAKIAEKKIDVNAQVTFNEQEWERMQAWANESTWKDEYVTVSVVSILNIIVVGGVLSAFGLPQILEGIVVAVNALNAVMESPSTGEVTRLGTIMTVTIFAAIGVYGWKKLVG